MFLFPSLSSDLDYYGGKSCSPEPPNLLSRLNRVCSLGSDLKGVDHRPT